MGKINRKDKVMVIGLDGATLDLIKPWVNEGKLPGFKRMMEEGVHGRLQSVIRPGSPQAWSSFITGKNPGKHRVFYFIERRPNSYDIKFVNAKSRRGDSLWKLLSNAGKKVGVINVPITYPPEKVNGFMISGVDSPGVESKFTYPENLIQEINNNVGNYIIEAGVWGFITGGRYKEALEKLSQTIEIRYKTHKYLSQKYQWDLLMTVFTAADRVQHNFWKFMDVNHPLYDEMENKEYGSAIYEVYKNLDDILMEIIDEIDDDTTLIIVSDHGMGGITNRSIYLNKWLEAEGLLFFKDRNNTDFLRLVKGKIKEKIYVDTLKFVRRQLWKRLHRKTKEKLVRLMPGLRNKMSSLFFFSRINMANTMAYAEENRSIIWINLEGRDPKGCVKPGEQYEQLRDRIIKGLESLRDPETGEKIVEKGYRREEIYWGEYVKDSPDIVIMWKDDKYVSRPSYTSKSNEYLRIIGLEELRKLEFNLQANAQHRRDGIFLMKGRAVKKGVELKNLSIMDLTPTILYLLGQFVPNDMDGRVIGEAFNEDFFSNNPVKFTNVSTGEKTDSSEGEIYSDEDNTVIEERLKGLGYL